MTVLFSKPAQAGDGLSPEDRVELIRGLTSEYATVKDFLPRSKKPLVVQSNGGYDKDEWARIGQQSGPAARVGDLIQITRVTIAADKLIFEINGGLKQGGSWRDHVQVGMGGQTSPISRGDSNAVAGTNLEIDFHRALQPMKAAEVKKILSGILDFEKRSASELYSQQLTPEMQRAIADKRAEKGMDREQVVLAMGRPERKLRETKEGVDLEDWIFGRPPGRIVFVTFEGNKVVKVKETYAGLGAEAAAPLPLPR